MYLNSNFYCTFADDDNINHRSISSDAGHRARLSCGLPDTERNVGTAAKVAGAVVSIPMRASGKSRTNSFLLGCLSGIAQPLGAILVILLATLFVPMLPYMLAFAAGAMLYVVVEELIPEASNGQHTNLSTIFFAVGFALMMLLDVVLE